MIAIRGQTSTEYVVLLAVSLFFFAFVLTYVSDQISLMGRAKSTDAARSAVQSITDAARSVYYQGAGARQFVYVTFPEGTEEGSPRIVNNTVTLQLYRSDISYKTDFPIYGTLPNASGTYSLEIFSDGASVRVGILPFIVVPSSLFYSMCAANTSQSSNAVLSFTNNLATITKIDLVKTWPSSSVNLTLSDSSLTLAQGESHNVPITVTAGANVAGTFSGTISANTTNYTMSIPVTVTVSACYSLPSVAYGAIDTFKNSSYTDSKFVFTPAETIQITGGNWTSNSQVTVDIKNPASASVFGYPKNVPSDGSGNINDSWNTANATAGSYTIYANQTGTTKTKVITVKGC